MTPTTFPCPFCSKKMGVGPELLGRKVRCPNCKEVLVAPAPAPAEPPPAAPPRPPRPPAPAPPPVADFPVFNLPDPETRDSIFGEAADEGDDVFGSDPGQQPVPELPPPVAPPPPMAVFAPPPPPPVAQIAPAADPFAGFAAAHANPTPAVVPAPSPPPVAVAAYPPPVAAPANPWAGFDQATPPVAAFPAPPPPPPAAVVDEEPPREPRRDRRPERDDRKPRPERGRPAPAIAGGGLNALIKIGFFLMIPYALLMSVLAIYGLFIREGKAPEGHPLSLIPDGRGEFPPADRKKTGKLGVPLDGPLPPELRAGLGKKITVGDVEVEPVAVAVRKLVVVKEPERGKAVSQTLPRGLVLTLNVRNTSSDLTFHPLDPGFNRKTYGTDAPPTALVVGKETYAGGAVTWPFDKNLKRAYERAQEGDDQPLGPGESRKYVVTTDGKESLVKTVQAARDTLVWRVQVRRGLVEFRGREVPVTALIGVEFQASDVTEE